MAKRRDSLTYVIRQYRGVMSFSRRPYCNGPWCSWGAL